MEEELIKTESFNDDIWDNIEAPSYNNNKLSPVSKVLSALFFGLFFGVINCYFSNQLEVALMCSALYAIEAALFTLFAFSLKKGILFVPLLLVSAYFSALGVSTSILFIIFKKN